MPVRFSKQNNPFYPLPPDYELLSAAGKRQARLNALFLQETPEDLVYAWALFREKYLMPEGVGWYKRLLPSPPMHYMIPYDMGSWSMNAWAATRSFAKTTVVREMAMLLMLTRPAFGIALIQATEKKSKKSMSVIRRQLTHNPYINDDFGYYYGVSLKPPRGERTWNNEILELPNGSIMEGLSVNGALRGERPDLILVDDPEYDDEDDGTDSSRKVKLIEDFERLLFKVLLGMLDDGTGIFWIGTLISRNSFLYHVTKGDDARFKHWNRRVLSVVMPDGSLLWEAKWDEQAIRDKLARLGESAFNSEMMNNPGSGSDKILKIHPVLCTYRVEGDLGPEPLQSDARIVYYEGVKDGGDPLRTEKPFREHVATLYRMITVDYAPTVSAASDYSCVGVWGFDRDDVLWVLDIFLGKVRDNELIRVIWDMAYKWRVRAIGVESVGLQKHLADRVASLFSQQTDGTTWRPRVIPVKYPARMSKSERIQGLEWRFNSYRVRYPAHRQHEPGMKELWFQTENFTPDLSNLRHDDAIDTMAMHQYMLRKRGAANKDRGPLLKSPVDRIRSGELVDEKTGIPYISGLSHKDLNMDLVRDLLHRKYDALDIPRDGVDLWTPGPFSVLH